ncbi:MAG TPA: NAD(P)-dependent oxidoreductase [Candidatus Omnitrophota bacterium]|nr:NAD(P)-dependent oxidoreductase [Candidatus Omnitrophota bacterium]
MAKILVTGGAGYIGSVLVPLLLRENHEVTVVDNFMFRQASLLDCCANPRFQVVRGDVRNAKLMEKLVKDADYLFPLACLTGAPLCSKDPCTARGVIVDSVKELLKMRGRHQRIIYPTTNSGYGIGQTGIACDEKTPLNPISLYGRLKVEAEKMILDSGESITFRLATAFGVSPRMRLDLLVNDFVYRAVFDGFVVLFEADFIRNYIHVRDVAKAFLHGMNSFEKMKGETYNVGLSDCNLSKRQLCEAIKKHVPHFAITASEVGKDPDQRNYIVSNEKIEKSGFRPDVSLDAGIQELLKCYRIIKRTQYANV